MTYMSVCFKALSVSNVDKVSCLKKEREPLMGLKLTTDRCLVLPVRGNVFLVLENKDIFLPDTHSFCIRHTFSFS